MVDGLHILFQNRAVKLLAIGLSGVGREFRKREDGGDLTNVQYKPICNCYNESHYHNEYILIKKKEMYQGDVTSGTREEKKLIHLDLEGE
jgi:hypothetical protein